MNATYSGRNQRRKVQPCKVDTPSDQYAMVGEILWRQQCVTAKFGESTAEQSSLPERDAPTKAAASGYTGPQTGVAMGS